MPPLLGQLGELGGANETGVGGGGEVAMCHPTCVWCNGPLESVVVGGRVGIM